MQHWRAWLKLFAMSLTLERRIYTVGVVCFSALYYWRRDGLHRAADSITYVV